MSSSVSVPQLALLLFVVNSHNHLFVCGITTTESEAPDFVHATFVPPRSCPRSSFSQSDSVGAVTIHSHNHNHNQDKGSTSRMESTMRALQQKMRAAGKCGADKFDGFNPMMTPQLRAQSSMLQAASAIFGVENQARVQAHIAATGNYDPEHEIVHVGVNVKGPLGGCIGPQCVTMCWCGDGAFLRVHGYAYKVASIMYKDRSLCMKNTCEIEMIGGMFSQGKKLAQEDRTFTVQVDDIPNAPFRLTVESVSHWSTGLLEAHMSFSEGSMGVMIPGWICIKCCNAAPLSLFVAMTRIGCIHRIEKTDGDQEIQRAVGKVDPTFRMVQLGNHRYFLPNTVPDQVVCLAKDVQRLLMGGDAVVDTCPAS